MSGVHLPEPLLQALQTKAEGLGLELIDYLNMLQTTLELFQPENTPAVEPFTENAFILTLNETLAAQAFFLKHETLGD
ncbi:MAG: hypothetical protein IV090_05830 [Candidatus Sericytochromatia bacterium]|jgi:hypothetical protein|nr:hypothetical protein [Candidatus Sericytochromatia bacterium]